MPDANCDPALGDRGSSSMKELLFSRAMHPSNEASCACYSCTEVLGAA